MEENYRKYKIKGQLKDFQTMFSMLMRASGSVYQCVFANTEYHAYLSEFEDWYHKTLEDVCTEEFVTASLATNVICDRKTGNDVGWGDCSISISAFGVDYETGGGVNFGWEVCPEWDGEDYIEDTHTVYCFAREGGTLEKSLIEHGFLLEE